MENIASGRKEEITDLRARRWNGYADMCYLHPLYAHPFTMKHSREA